jgi:hypothetical protein
MLEYNVRSGALAAQVKRLGTAIGRDVEPLIGYRSRDALL